MSWKPEVIADSTGNWYGNQLRFATPKEALDNVLDLSGRWTSVRDTRIVECNDPVSHSYANGKLTSVEKVETAP